MYEKIGPFFDYIYPHEELARALSPAIAKIKRQLGKKNRPRILDMCCGTGRALSVFKKELPQAELYGIDNNRRMIEAAQRTFSKIPADHFVEGDVLESRIGESKTEKFDVVLIAGGSLHHFTPSERLRVLGTAARALDSGGLLIFDVIKRARKAAAGTVHPYVRRYFHANGIPVAVVYVTHYDADKIWQQNLVLEWLSGEKRKPRVSCDTAQYYALTPAKARTEAASVGLRHVPLNVKYEPSTYLCFTKHKTRPQKHAM